MSKNTRVPESPVIWELIFSDGSKRLYQEPHTCIINHDNTLRRTKKQPGCGQWKWSISLDVAPFPVTVTTKIITFLEGIPNYSKTLFATGILEKGPHLTSCFQRIKKHPQRRKPHKTRRFFYKEHLWKKTWLPERYGKIWWNLHLVSYQKRWQKSNPPTFCFGGSGQLQLQQKASSIHVFVAQIPNLRKPKEEQEPIEPRSLPWVGFVHRNQRPSLTSFCCGEGGLHWWNIHHLYLCFCVTKKLCDVYEAL